MGKFKSDSLPESVLNVVLNKATEAPFTGEYNDFNAQGTYLCRLCGIALFRATTKFHSGCGWPSFDNHIEGTVSRVPDEDGQRIEIICTRCQCHLGHVFTGEQFTFNNTRHCVNSLSLDFVSDLQVLDTEEAILAGGCFWGVEYYFKKLPGVLKVEVGYTGGLKKEPTYREICMGETGHVEAVRIVFDVNQISYEQVVKFFFEIHDPTQQNGQGPDIGPQYLSKVFYYSNQQKQFASETLEKLLRLGYEVATKLEPVKIFWPAEEYHQDYYTKTAKVPYCHRYVRRFD
jgi:peptide methionine sulfoxide reductase msrA/msrB